MSFSPLLKFRALQLSCCLHACCGSKALAILWKPQSSFAPEASMPALCWLVILIPTVQAPFHARNCRSGKMLGRWNGGDINSQCPEWYSRQLSFVFHRMEEKECRKR